MFYEYAMHYNRLHGNGYSRSNQFIIVSEIYTKRTEMFDWSVGLEIRVVVTQFEEEKKTLSKWQSKIYFHLKPNT